MDFTTLKTAVEVDGGFPSVDATTRIGQWVNAAYNDILGRRGWSWRESAPTAVALVASQEAYALTGTAPVVPDFGGMIEVLMELSTNGARVKLKPCDQQTYDDITAHSRDNGVPAIYTVNGGAPATTSATVTAGGQTQLRVWPVPLATATNGQQLLIRYFRGVGTVQLSANGDIPLLPVEFHDAIVLRACARGLIANDQEENAKAFMVQFEERMQQMIAEDERIRPIRDQRMLKLVPPVEPDPRYAAQQASALTYPQGATR